MSKIRIGVNMEFVRSHDKPFAWGVEKAAEIGYEYIEPMVHWGRELLSEAGYFHSVSHNYQIGVVADITACRAEMNYRRCLRHHRQLPGRGRHHAAHWSAAGEC